MNIHDPNVVVLTWTGDELSHRHVRVWRTDTRTHGQTDAGNDNSRTPKKGKRYRLAFSVYDNHMNIIIRVVIFVNVFFFVLPQTQLTWDSFY